MSGGGGGGAVLSATPLNPPMKYILCLLKATYYCINIIAAITCPALPAPSSGTRLGCPGNATMYYDTLCQFSCNDGYIWSGSQSRRCQQNGTWSGQNFNCEGMKY